MSRNSAKNKNRPLPKETENPFRRDERRFGRAVEDFWASSSSSAVRDVRSRKRLYPKKIQYHSPRFESWDCNGAIRSRIAIVDARTSVGVVKKCSRKSVTNDSINSAVKRVMDCSEEGKTLPVVT